MVKKPKLLVLESKSRLYIVLEDGEVPKNAKRLNPETDLDLVTESSLRLGAIVFSEERHNDQLWLRFNESRLLQNRLHDQAIIYAKIMQAQYAALGDYRNGVVHMHAGGFNSAELVDVLLFNEK